MKARGLQQLQNDIVSFAGFLRDRVAELDDWSKIKLLTVQINRLRDWCRDGLLCIGDSAHAMSPAGGVGINLAIQDAVATANLLAGKLRDGGVQLSDLEAVQRRREWPSRATQRAQIFIHEHLLERIFNSTERIPPPLFLRLCERFPLLRRFPARMVGLGFRPEHIQNDK